MEIIGFKGVAQGSVWIFEILLGIGILGVVNWSLNRFIKFISKRYSKHSYDWRGKLSYILYTPLNVFILLLTLAYSIDILGNRFGFAAALNYLSPFRSAAIVGCAAWILLRLKAQWHRSWVASSQQGKRAIDPGTAHVLGRISSSIIGVVATLVVLQILGLDIKPLIVFGGVGAAAIGFASRDVIANFFGGLMLHITRPLSVGEEISIKEKGITGVVEDIGWYFSVIRDEEKRPIYVPNSIFSKLLVTNISRRSHQKFEQTFIVDLKHEDDMESLIASLKEKVASHSEVDTQLPVLVFSDQKKGDATSLIVRFYCLETRPVEFLDIKQKFVRMIQTHVN